MQESHLFEYAVIRVVPRVEREEFVNVGVILYCSHEKFLDTRFILNPDRVKALCGEVDLMELNNHIESFERICRGGSAAGPIGALSIAERFRWLTATRSTILQTSKVHPGLCDDANKTLLRLYHELVL
ncbi:DUF3037 domain-containing protein [Chryseolinea soli]|uniref:DUF3037 domain-containing protein n=1 Tax=Chryseolinea soli TaxID=2321403 RepID=A0A385SH38_9BACT|nr:DUF3037 domain-containing protein [Chryseolinea soli]AYB29597.1 DUF3037 domain-containing protein [Chryseolinea soli]